jgi:ubiquitin C-terminal hydrolase
MPPKRFTAGLVNEGQTCHLNAVLQCLFALKPFVDFLYKKPFEKIDPERKFSKLIDLAVIELFSRLEKGDVIETNEIIKLLLIDPANQEDIEEQLIKLLGILENTITSNERVAADFKHLYTMKLKKFRYNKKTKVEVSADDTFSHLILPISDINDLESCVRNYFLPVQRTVSEETIKHELPTTFPPVLTISLTRWKAEDPSKPYLQTKDNQNVKIPVELDLGSLISESVSAQRNRGSRAEYTLTAVVIHSGTFRGGHYYCYCFNFEDNNWWKCNDSEITNVSQDSVLNDAEGIQAVGRNAYMLFYVKNDQLSIQSSGVRCPVDLECYLRVFGALNNNFKEESLASSTVAIEDKVWASFSSLADENRFINNNWLISWFLQYLNFLEIAPGGEKRKLAAESTFQLFVFFLFNHFVLLEYLQTISVVIADIQTKDGERILRHIYWIFLLSCSVRKTCFRVPVSPRFRSCY